MAKICIDIKCLRYNNSGIGRYLKSMLDALQKLDTVNEYALYSPSSIEYPVFNKNFRLCPTPGLKILGRQVPGILWQQTTLVKSLRAQDFDIFWGPEQTLPLPDCHCKKVLTVHDFVYKRYPETMRKSVRWINNGIGSKSIFAADKIAVVSDFTKQELEHFYPQVPSERIVVIPNGTHAPNETHAPNTSKPRKRQLLFVGSLEPRKNLKNLIKALEILKARGMEIPLLLTGPKGWKNTAEVELLRDSPVAGQIHHLGFVSDEQLQELYATSSAVIFPSFYEGFGLPVLEALAAKTPVLTTKNSVMESIAKKCALYFDANDPESIAHTIADFFASSEPWEMLTPLEQERGQILDTYRWENSARKLMETFKELT